MLKAHTQEGGFCPQWHIVPIVRGSKDPGSIVGKSWQHKTSNNPNMIAQWLSLGHNVGLLLGPKSGVIDIEDDTPEGKQIVEEWFGGLMTPTYRSSKSTHRLFRYDDRFSDEGVKKDICGVEFRFGQDAGQSVIPPSVHESGAKYEWVEGLSPDDCEPETLPEEFWQWYISERDKEILKHAPRIVSSTFIGGDGLIDIAKAYIEQQNDWNSLLTGFGWKYSDGPSDNQHWIRPGKDSGVSATLNYGGNNTLRVFSTSVPQLEPDSSYDKFNFLMCMGGYAVDQAFKFASDVLPPEMVEQWKREQDAKQLKQEVDLSKLTARKIINEEDSPTKKYSKDDRPSLSSKELSPGGLLGDLVSHILDTAKFPHPEMTLATCIAFSGLILGRRVEGFDSIRPNVYCLSVAESGAGKNHSRLKIKELFDEVGIPQMETDATSDTAIVDGLMEHNSTFFMQWDEVGLHLKSAKKGKGNDNFAAFLSDIFTSSSSSYTYKRYANKENNKRLDQPHLSINGTTTEGSLYKGGLDLDDVEQGLFGRFLLFRPVVMHPKEQYWLPKKPIPESIVSRVKSWWDFRPWKMVEGKNMLPEKAFPMFVDVTDAAKDRYTSYAEAIWERLEHENVFERALWCRSREKTNKLALIHACMKDGYRENIKIDLDSMDWAIAVSNYSTRGMIFDIKFTLVDNKYESEKQQFLSRIPPKGITLWELNRQVRMNAADRNRVRLDLIDTGFITVEETPSTSGRPGHWVRRLK